MPPSAAAIAAVAAAAQPPPGAAVGAASCSINGSTPERIPPTAIFPLITAARRFSKISDESKFSICRNHSAASSSAFRSEKRFAPGANSSDRHFPTHHGGQAVLQDQRRVEVLDLQKPLRRVFQRLLGDQDRKERRVGKECRSRWS